MCISLKEELHDNGCCYCFSVHCVCGGELVKTENQVGTAQMFPGL